MSLLDPETFVPQCDALVAHRIAKLLSVSVQHIRNLIDEGEIKVPEDEIARVNRKEKPWTMVSVPRENVIDFIRRRTVPLRRDTQRRGVAKTQ